jgi:cytochrome c-type biogenesis protein CcmE
VSFSGTVIGGLQTSGSFTSTVNYTLFDFNAQNQNFDVSTQYSGYLTPLSTNNIQASLSGPSPFPVVTTSDLNTLNNGKIPSDLPATSVSDNVMVKVPAGTFNTDQVTFDNGAMLWFDAKSGLLVQASGTFLGYPGYGNGISEELVKTNIPTSGSTSSLWIYIASAAAIVVIILIASIFAIRRRSKVSKQPAGIASQPVNERIELKLERLKKLVEEGLISQQEYEMKKKELLGEQ